MWIRRTSRGRRDLPLSFREVAGIWVGWEAGAEADVVVVGFWLALGVCDEVLLFMAVVVLALLEVGSVVGGVVGCAVWFGDAIFLE